MLCMNFMLGVVICCHQSDPKRIIVCSGSGTSRNSGTLPAIAYASPNNTLEIVRRGRNAATKRPRRVDPEIYQQATSLETLMATSTTDSQRLTKLLQKLKLEPNLEEY